MKIKVIRKNRKTLSIKITDEGEVIVTAPLYLSNDKIDEIIRKKEQWIISRLQHTEASSRQKDQELKSLMFLGKAYKVNVHEAKYVNKKVIFDGNEFHIYVLENLKENKEKYIRQELNGWYRLQERKIYEERIAYYASKLNVYPKRIVIKDQQTRWGSCSSKGNINLNYRVVIAPIEIVDYLVVHELCHLIQLNHSKEFWNLVESILPNYKESEKWLKVNGSSLR